MKKLMIAVAVIITLGTGFVNAGGVAANFNFDGKGIGARNFMEAIKAPNSCRNDNIACELPKPVPAPIKEKVDRTVIARTTDSSAQTAATLNPRMVTAMDESIGSAIAYVNTHGLGPQLRPGFECLRDKGTIEEKSAFVYASEGTNYNLPAKCTRPDTKDTCTCVAWDYHEVCYDTTIIKDVCDVVAGVCAAGHFIGGVWTVPECTASYMLCKAVSVIKQVCAPVKYCSQQSGCGPTFG